MEKEKIPQYMLDHFAEDKKAFARYDELLQISGDHMSHIRKDLTEVKDILVKNAEDTKEYRKTVDEHMARVEPYIKAFEDEKKVKAYIDLKGEEVIKWSKRIGAVTLIGSAFVWLIKKLL